MKTFIALFALVAVAVANPVSPLVQLIVNINGDVPAGAASDLVSIDHEIPAFGPALAEIDSNPAIIPVIPETVAVAEIAPVVTIPVVEGVQPIQLPEAVAVAEIAPVATIPVVEGVQPILLPEAAELPAAVLPAVVMPEIAVNLPEILN